MCCTASSTRPSATSEHAAMTQDSGVPAESIVPLSPVAVGQTAGKVRTPWGECWRRFKKQPVGIVAAIFVGLLVCIAVIAPWIAPFDPENFFDYDTLNSRPSATHWFGVAPLGCMAVSAPWRAPSDPENFFAYDTLNGGPSATHWFGCDPLGRDIFSRILA